MDSVEFARILGQAFNDTASEHGQHYPAGGADAWGQAGAAYLAFALCGLPTACLRKLQYDARDKYGPVILDCKWYDGLVSKCLDGADSVKAYLPAPDRQLCLCEISRELFLEMLDFCREG